MKTIARWLAVLGLLVAPSAWAATDSSYSGLYVFGDSLVDAGNAYVGTGGDEASRDDGYFRGRFSNGPNFADYLSLALTGSSSVAALRGGTNFSVGGADAELKDDQVSPSFLAQVGLYATMVGPFIPADALVLVTFGGNDVRDTIGIGGDVDFTQASSNLLTGLGLLYGFGARNFVVTGSPDIGLLPVSIVATGGDPVRLGELTQRSQDISDLFEIDAGLFGTLPGNSVSFFDLLDYEHMLLADPAAFGLPATLDKFYPCQIPGAGGPQSANCASSLYFDLIHPTTTVHQAIAESILDQIGVAAVPEPAQWAMILLGFGVIGGALRRRPAVMVAVA